MIAVTVDLPKKVERNHKNVDHYILQQISVIDHYIKIDPMTHNDDPLTYINVPVIQDDSPTSGNNLFKVLAFDEESLSVSRMEQLKELTNTEENEKVITPVKGISTT